MKYAITRCLLTFQDDKCAVTVLEYALIGLFVGVVAATALSQFGTNISGT